MNVDEGCGAQGTLAMMSGQRAASNRSSAHATSQAACVSRGSCSRANSLLHAFQPGLRC